MREFHRLAVHAAFSSKCRARLAKVQSGKTCKVHLAELAADQQKHCAANLDLGASSFQVENKVASVAWALGDNQLADWQPFEGAILHLCEYL